MSLLLDALKKAAEQKARKSKLESQPESSSPDETEVSVAPEEASELDQTGGQPSLPSRRGERDETQLDESQFDSRTITQTGVDAQAGDSDETRTMVDDPSRQMQTGEDETIVFADEDVSGYPDVTQTDDRTVRDETLTDSRLFNEDETQLVTSTSYDDQTEEASSPSAESGSDANLPEDATEMVTQASGGTDETEYTWLGDDETGVDVAPPVGDDTDISVPTRTASDIDSGSAEPVTEIELTDVNDTVAGDSDGTDMTEGPDADLSLLLLEREVTGYTGTSVTDPQARSDQLNALQAGEDLALVDTTRHSPPADSTITEGSSTATTRSAETVTGESTTRRVDSTSTRTEGAATRTYAPDNYDRTLMKLPNEDASRLFAGMKSDSDVVMTPDYAKKVFQSKSSAQRLHHYKLYAGIAFAILLGIGVYGLFEMQAESARIESSLQPLKRDPMPGLIRPAREEPAGLTLPAAEVDEKTIELIESAGQPPVAGAEAVGERDEADPGIATPDVAAAGVIAAETPDAPAPATAATQPTPQRDSVISGEIGTDAGAAAASAAGSLEIRSSSRIPDRDRWLREAYEAYVAGDDARALELYKQVLGIDPRNRNALLARAAINVQNGETAAAIADYQALLLANPKDSLAMSSLLTIANFSPQEAETQIKLLLRDEPESPYLNFALANAYGSQSRWQEAQAHYFIALQNNPDDPNYAYNLAVSLEHIAKPKVAIAYYQRALDNFDKGLATFSKEVVDQRLETLRKL